jgi:hypothetical protein
MKLFQHPLLKSQKLITSHGVIELDAKGQAQVTVEQFDHLMKIPANSKLQSAADLNKNDVLSKEELESLDPKELKAIAIERKLKFDRNTTKEQLVTLIFEDTQKPPLQPPLSEQPK